MNRRVSVIGPLILIAIGVLFLLHNLNQDLSIPKLVAQYWPWVLVGWGAIRLAEILAWHSRGQALPPAGISGGEWSFVVFLCLLGGGVAAAVNHGPSWPLGRFPGVGWHMMGESYDFPVSAEAGGDKLTRIVVENLRGTARISGTAEAGVKLTGRKSVRALYRQTAERADRDTPVEMQRQGDILYIRTNQNRWGGSERITSDVEIAVPAGVLLECKSRVGDFEITGMKANVKVDSDNSGVRLQDIAGNVEILVRKSDIVRAINVQGNIDLRGSGEDLEFDNITGQVTADFPYTGDLEFRNLAKPLRFESSSVNLAVESVAGRLQLTRGEIEAENFSGPVRIRTRSKDIRLSSFTGPAVVDLERGDIHLAPGRSPLGAIEARTKSGEIEMSLPDKAGFSLKASVNKGSVENDYGLPLTEDSKGPGARLDGTSGVGPAITLEAGRGKIRVSKSSSVVAKAQDQ